MRGLEKDVQIVKEAPSKPKSRSGRLSETGPSVTLQGGLGRTVHQLLLLLVILSGTHPGADSGGGGGGGGLGV